MSDEATPVDEMADMLAWFKANRVGLVSLMSYEEQARIKGCTEQMAKLLQDHRCEVVLVPDGEGQPKVTVRAKK